MPAHVARQSEQVVNSEARSPGRQDKEGVDPVYVGPVRRNRTDKFLSGLPVEHPVVTPGVGVANQLEILAAQRMEGMDDDEPSRTVATICS